MKILVFLAILLTGIAVMTSTSSATTSASLPQDECDVTTGAGCIINGISGTISLTLPSTPLPPSGQVCCDGAESDAHGTDPTTAIDEWGICRYVDNNSTNSIFVPFRTSKEWSQFIENTPANIILAYCARATNSPEIVPVKVSPNFPVNESETASDYCDPKTAEPTTSATSVTLLLPYRQVGGPSETFTGPFVFNCFTNGKVWQKTVTQVVVTPGASPDITSWSGGVPSGPVSSGWTVTDETTSANNTGVCGAANGVVATSAPTNTPASNLCSSGTASVVSGEGPWNWSCAGIGEGTSASCSTISATGCTTTFGGSTCSGSLSMAQALFYKLTPNFPNPLSLNSESGNVDMISAANQEVPDKIYVTKINVPVELSAVGLPKYTNLKTWSGVCYDGGYDAPVDGDYTIVTAVDDSVAIWIDGNLIGNNNDGIVTPDVEENLGTGPSRNIAQAQGEPVPFQPVYLSAGTHDVMVKYMQGWVPYLGVQVWIYKPGDTPFDYTQNPAPSATESVCEKHKGNICVLPDDSHLMQLKAPPGGVINCPHRWN